MNNRLGGRGDLDSWNALGLALGRVGAAPGGDRGSAAARGSDAAGGRRGRRRSGHSRARIGHRDLWFALGYLVVVDSLVGFALCHWLLRSALVSMYAYAVPVVAYLVGVIVLADPFHPAVLLGAVAIVAAVAAEVRPGT